jgi:TetR/AcrR family transcriptional repressor of nem operon
MSAKRIELEHAATEAVQRSGLQHLSFRTLAEEVGVKSSSVHYYFPGKSDLAAALISKYTVDFLQALCDIDARQSKASLKLEEFFKLFEAVAKANKFCLCGMMAAEVELLDENSRRLLDEYFRLIEDWICELFIQASQQFDCNLPPRSLARMLMSGLEGAILLDRVAGNNDHLQAHRDFFHSLFA